MTYDDFPEKEDDTYRIDYGNNEKSNLNVINIQFGEGYQQIVPIGKNYKSLEFSVTWGNMRYNLTDDIEKKEAGNIIYEFLKEREGVIPFWFRKLKNQQKKLFIANEVNLSNTKFDLVSISCTLKEFKGFGDTHTLGDVINAEQ